MDIRIDKITKDNQKLLLEVVNAVGNYAVYTYDLTTGVLKTNRGYIIKKENLDNWRRNFSTYYESTLLYWIRWGRNDILNNLASYYKVIKDFDLGIGAFSWCHSPENLKCNAGDLPALPKGFSKFVEELPKKYLENISLVDLIYLFQYKVKNNPSTKELNILTQTVMVWGVNNWTEGFHTIFPIINNDLKTGNDILTLRNGMNTLHKAFFNINMRKEALDFTKGIWKNIELCNAYFDTMKSELIAERESVILSLETMSYCNLTVVVPKGIPDLKDEGEQQHNCVGSYYNDTILERRNFIYFIRKTDCVNKSYVTCRFNIESDRTVEARIRNNDSLYDTDALDFINIIDEKIRGLIRQTA